MTTPASPRTGGRLRPAAASEPQSVGAELAWSRLSAGPIADRDELEIYKEFKQLTALRCAQDPVGRPIFAPQQMCCAIE